MAIYEICYFTNADEKKVEKTLSYGSYYIDAAIKLAKIKHRQGKPCFSISSRPIPKEQLQDKLDKSYCLYFTIEDLFENILPDEVFDISINDFNVKIKSNDIKMTQSAREKYAEGLVLELMYNNGKVSCVDDDEVNTESVKDIAVSLLKHIS